jgi:hypothetical protein
MPGEIRALRLEVDRGSTAPAYRSLLAALAGAWGTYFDEWAKVAGIQYGYKTYLKRASKLLFVGSIVAREVETTKDLTAGEAIRILRWLLGHHPSPTVVGDVDEDVRAIRRYEVVVQWMTWNQDAVTALARRLKLAATSKYENEDELPEVYGGGVKGKD